jgi:hypothetical protein
MDNALRYRFRSSQRNRLKLTFRLLRDCEAVHIRVASRIALQQLVRYRRSYTSARGVERSHDGGYHAVCFSPSIKRGFGSEGHMMNPSVNEGSQECFCTGLSHGFVRQFSLQSSLNDANPLPIHQ